MRVQHRGAPRDLVEAALGASSNRDELESAIERVLGERAAAHKSLQAIEKELAGYVAASLTDKVVSRIFENRGMKFLQAVANEIVAAPGRIAVLGGTGETSSLVLARSKDVAIDLKPVAAEAFKAIEGKGGGPDLSNVVKRFRRREILEAIMYPSKVISDQYQSVVVDLKNNDTQSGLLAGETDTTLTLITPTGEKIDINKADIAERRPSTVSIMPEGLLETMNLSDLVDLILFLEKGSGM